MSEMKMEMVDGEYYLIVRNQYKGPGLNDRYEHLQVVQYMGSDGEIGDRKVGALYETGLIYGHEVYEDTGEPTGRLLFKDEDFQFTLLRLLDFSEDAIHLKIPFSNRMEQK